MSFEELSKVVVTSGPSMVYRLVTTLLLSLATYGLALINGQIKETHDLVLQHGVVLERVETKIEGLSSAQEDAKGKLNELQAQAKDAAVKAAEVKQKLDDKIRNDEERTHEGH